MQISLIQHGPVNLSAQAMTAAAFSAWLAQYREADLRSVTTFSQKATVAVRASKRLVTSDAACAVQTAAALTDSLSFLQNKLFREIVLPSKLPAPSWLKMKPSAWLRLSHTMWLAGYTHHAELYVQVEQRARQAADLLIGYALYDKSIVLIGHAFFNTMIARELRQRGWIGPLWTNRKEGGCTTYHYHKEFVGKKLESTLGFTTT